MEHRAHANGTGTLQARGKAATQPLVPSCVVGVELLASSKQAGSSMKPTNPLEASLWGVGMKSCGSANIDSQSLSIEEQLTFKDSLLSIIQKLSPEVEASTAALHKAARATLLDKCAVAERDHNQKQEKPASAGFAYQSGCTNSLALKATCAVRFTRPGTPKPRQAHLLLIAVGSLLSWLDPPETGVG